MRTILYITVCFLTGCLARPHMDKQSFIFATPSIATPTAASGSRVLGIRTLQVAEPFEGRSFVYRTGEFSYDRDPYAEFMVHPADGLVLPVSAWFREAGGFSAVVEAGSALKPNTLVEIQVVRLYGDFRPSEHPTAVLAMRFVFFDAPNGVPGTVILQHEYSRGIPLKAQSAAALIAGWNQGLAEILDSAMLDFRRVDANAPKP
jgi:cholesterol transport system auxiliary component